MTGQNHNADWTDEDYAILRLRRSEGVHCAKIAAELKRSVAAVNAQIRLDPDEFAKPKRKNDHYGDEPIGRSESDELPSYQVECDKAFQDALHRERPRVGVNTAPCTDLAKVRFYSTGDVMSFSTQSFGCGGGQRARTGVGR